MVILLALVWAGVYAFLDSSGLVPHARSVDLYISGEWTPEEDRNCLGIQSRLRDEAPEITSLDCRIDGSAESPHNRKGEEVKFFGKTSRPDLLLSGTNDFEWRCRRTGSGFTCYASN